MSRPGGESATVRIPGGLPGNCVGRDTCPTRSCQATPGYGRRLPSGHRRRARATDPAHDDVATPVRAQGRGRRGIQLCVVPNRPILRTGGRTPENAGCRRYYPAEKASDRPRREGDTSRRRRSRGRTRPFVYKIPTGFRGAPSKIETHAGRCAPARRGNRRLSLTTPGYCGQWAPTDDWAGALPGALSDRRMT